MAYISRIFYVLIIFLSLFFVVINGVKSLLLIKVRSFIPCQRSDDCPRNLCVDQIIPTCVWAKCKCKNYND
ncbi:putative Late nodulin [Medicago truncatula]|uniref:Nodule Cysteine-Rich (NCR) secreted peptide n=1 Tax=Medicago truncatula TaxID=3880 RepID=A7KHB0_MEDTR|nr:nodule-specific cysteine-rich peptide 173 [Medicago truncatula]AES66051.1 Nodule Cysteine-Rich (NCR) secreted peptide [Medicago truncatula]RHN74280.1 putative Late nodulin [Medicago truncatula]